MSGKNYIGDGIYAQIIPGLGIALTTENGITETNRIILGPAEWRMLVRWEAGNEHGEPEDRAAKIESQIAELTRRMDYLAGLAGVPMVDNFPKVICDKLGKPKMFVDEGATA